MSHFHICYVMAPGGGPETYVRNLAPWLIEKGNRVSVVSLEKEMDFGPGIRSLCARTGNLHYYVSRIFGNYREWPLRLRLREKEEAVLKAIEKIHAGQPVDIVEVFEGLTIEMLKKRWKISVRIHGSDWSFRHFCKDYGSRNDASLIRIEKKQLEAADGVSAISQHSVRHISRACEIAAGKIQFIPYPVKTNVQPAANTGEKIIMSVGRLEKRKGTHILCQAMERVWAEYPDTELYLFGNEAGLGREQLLGMVSEKNRGRIHFMGFVTQEELAGFYKRALLYVAPTQYETFGYTILEAMSFGRPVVTTAVGAVPELVEDGVHGKIVPYGDPKKLAQSMIELLGDAEKRAAFGSNGWKKSLEYSMDKTGTQMLDFYKKILRPGE